MKKFLCLIIISFCLVVQVEALEIESKYAVLYNLNDGEVVYEVNSDEVTSVASLTKIMTTLVAVENIKNYDEKIILKEEMFNGLREANAYVIGLRSGQKVNYNDLVYGMFLASGADATRAVAISIAGSEEKFVELMNKKAKELGLKNTHFTNPVGLDDDKHYSTVKEVAIILKNAFKNEKFKEIFLTEKYVLSDKSITVTSSMRKAAGVNNIDVSNILGGKTGYTGNAGRCLASIAYDKDNKITYLLVTTNASSIKGPVSDAVNIYDEYFKNYKYQELVHKNDLIVKVPVKYSKTGNVNFYATDSVEKYLKNDYSKYDVKVKYKGRDVVTPKVKKGTKIGVVEVFYKREKVGELEVRLTEDIKFSLTGFIAFYKNIFIGFGILIVVSFGIVLKKLKSV